MIKIINYFFQSIFIYLFFLLGRILGINLSRKLFSSLFIIVGPFFKSKKITENNLNIFLGENSSVNKKKIINDMWKNYGKTFIEYIFLDYFRNKKSHISLEGKEHLSQIIKKNKPVIFISGHLANFELMSMEITKQNVPLATIYRPLNNFFFKSFHGIAKKKIRLFKSD